MATGSQGAGGHGLAPTPGEAELAELARLRERFRGHHIFHDVRWEGEVRYLAFRTASGVQPHTIITNDLAELREQLEQAAPPDLGTGLHFPRLLLLSHRRAGLRAAGVPARACCSSREWRTSTSQPLLNARQPGLPDLAWK